MGEVRHVRVFKNGRNRAIRIPRDMDVFGEEVVLERHGQGVLITPQAKKDDLIAWLDRRAAMGDVLGEEDRMPEFDDPPPEPESIFDDWED